MDIREELLEKVREVTSANLKNVMARADHAAKSPNLAVKPAVRKNNLSKAAASDYRMVVIGSSTGKITVTG